MTRPPTVCRLTRLRLLTMPVAAIYLLLGCGGGTQNVTVAVEPAPAPARVAFGLGVGGGYFYGLTVMTCTRDSVMWVVGTGGTNAGRPSRVVYGQAPAGFATRTGPVPLVPGCYMATAGSGFTRFVLRPDGSVAADSLRR